MSSKYSLWIQKVIHARWYLRDGSDYINNNKRYDKAHLLFDEAYEIAKQQREVSKIDLARICLWNGISMNENEDLDKYERNTQALKYYRKALRYLENVTVPRKIIIPLLASIYNSMGVAYHHRTNNWSKFPKKTLKYYIKSREYFVNNPDLHRKMIRVMKKVESNSGGRITRDYITIFGGSSDIEMTLVNVC